MGMPAAAALAAPLPEVLSPAGAGAALSFAVAFAMLAAVAEAFAPTAYAAGAAMTEPPVSCISDRGAVAAAGSCDAHARRRMAHACGEVSCEVSGKQRRVSS